jgi:hypothetical protein
MTNEEKALQIASLNGYMGSYDKLMFKAAMQMAKWKEQQMIEKACEWLKDNVNDSYLDWYDWEKCRLNKDELLRDFREAMEEQL